MLDVLKNLGKLLGVAVLAGVLGALGGILINSFMDDDEPTSPTATTMSPPLSTQPSSPAAGSGLVPGSEETVPVDEEKEEDRTEPEGSGQAIQPPPTTVTEPSPPGKSADRKILPLPKKPQPGKSKAAPEKKTEKKPVDINSKVSDKPKEAGKKADREAAKAAGRISETAKPAAGDKAPEAQKNKPKKPSPAAPAQDKPKQEIKDSKPSSFEEMVEAEKEEVLLVKSVSASTVDRTVVIRVALNRTAEPKLSRLVGKGKLRIILDFENAIRIKGRVPDVIKPPNPTVKGIRIGAHPDKLRIVLDLDPKLTYSLNQHQFSRAYVLEIKPLSD